ncbi:thioredoxin-like protein [Plectosphaerella cucumerina]|uniref:thioredoxin-dependent peroxiredoxin n=1 Tax=Plectosphaerella cucumerina TaxID=40658 RepID=A0A8K0TCF9_9PEZI|nr:thioredoxin-like protein [Plectosphaerella cucumerina]
MPVTLRKRKAPEPAPAPAPKKAAAAPKAKAKPAGKEKPVKAAPAKAEAVEEAPAAASKPVNGSAKAKKPAVGDVITIGGFGGEVETNDGEKTTLEALLEESKTGVVLFTYPKASTPGCTTQVCLFRDSYEPLTAKGLAIYGLSSDSPKANTTFKTKQKLPYTLLCDPQRTLIDAIGLKAPPSKTTRGVFVVDKKGKVLAAEPGGPAATLAVVKKLAEELEDVDGGADAEAPAINGDAKAGEEESAVKEGDAEAGEKADAEEKAEKKDEEKADEKADEKAEEKEESKADDEKAAA